MTSLSTMNAFLNTEQSSLIIAGVLKRTFLTEWTVSLTDLHKKMAKSDLFFTQSSSNCLVVSTESDIPNEMIFNVWFYTTAVVGAHSLVVSLSLLNDKNRLCYTVTKRVNNSKSRTRNVCTTVNFGTNWNYSKKFFHNGALRIQCCVDTLESSSSSLELSKEDFNKAEALLQAHLLNKQNAGFLVHKQVFTWTVPEMSMRKEELQVVSDTFTFGSSDFWFSEFNSEKSKKYEWFEISLNRRTSNVSQKKIRATLSILDNYGITHCIKEDVIEDSSEIFLNYSEILKDRRRFLDKGKLNFCCSLKIDNSSDVSNCKTSKPDESTQNDNVTDFDTNSSKLSRTNELYSSPIGKFLKSVRNPSRYLVAKNHTFVSSEKKFELENALNAEFELAIGASLHEARLDSPLASTISLLFLTAKQYRIPHLRETVAKVLLNAAIKNDLKEAAMRMIIQNIGDVSDTETWLSFMKNESDLVTDIIKMLAQKN